MRRTQIQLPEPLYQEVKKLAKTLDWSITEVLRRGAEYMVQCHRTSEGLASTKAWSPPMPMSLGTFRSSHDTWRELANDPLEEDS